MIHLLERLAWIELLSLVDKLKPTALLPAVLLVLPALLLQPLLSQTVSIPQQIHLGGLWLLRLCYQLTLQTMTYPPAQWLARTSYLEPVAILLGEKGMQ